MIQRVRHIGQRHVSAGALHPVGQHRRPRRHPLNASCPTPPTWSPPAPRRGRRRRDRRGACSITTCAFVPPRPNDDTPARRGPGSPATGWFRWARRIGSMTGSMARFHRVKCRLGGIGLVADDQHRLDETRDPRRRLQVAQIGLHRPQRTGRIAAGRMWLPAPRIRSDHRARCPSRGPRHSSRCPAQRRRRAARR